MRDIGFDYLSVFGLDPVAFIDLAAELGAASVGLNYRGASNPIPPAVSSGLREAPERREAIRRALQDTGVALALMEGFAIGDDLDAVQTMQDLDDVAALGAEAICCIAIGRDEARMADHLRQMAQWAAERGMAVTTEVGAGRLRTWEGAVRMAEAVAHPGFGLLLDTMHFFRSGGTVDAFAALDPALIRYVQLCDVPMPAVIEDYMAEALFERRAPGDGDLPLAQLVPLIPRHARISLEIPIRSEAERGVPHRERLRDGLAKARRL